MKLLIAELATGLLFTGAPAWADPWKDESGHGWRGKLTNRIADLQRRIAFYG